MTLAVLTFLLVLAGCSERPLAHGCAYPQFKGSEGITHNEDLEQAFADSRPLLDGLYRYYDSAKGNVLWGCEEAVKPMQELKVYNWTHYLTNTSLTLNLTSALNVLQPTFTIKAEEVVFTDGKLNLTFDWFLYTLDEVDEMVWNIGNGTWTFQRLKE